MQSYFTGAVVIALEPLTPTSFKAAFGPPEHEPVPEISVNGPSREHTADELDANPRYSLHQFHSEILPDDRVVSVYLPPQYLEQEERRFPVFYLQDGQNLFDGRTSYIAGRTWNAHTTADRLTKEGKIEPVILVGVANTGLRRMAEYTPTRDFKMGGGEGRSYGRLLMEELKPLIDRTYRTLADAKNTGLGGSSLGGLISLFLGFAHPGGVRQDRGDVAIAMVGPSQYPQCNQRSGDEARSAHMAGHGDGGRSAASARCGHAGAPAAQTGLAERG